MTPLGSPQEAQYLFSIVTVCRNAERSIAKTVESVLAQAPFGGAFEHIVVDGASTDGTLRALARHPHLRVLSEPDAGIYDAMNKGVCLARGDYIGMLNADDWYEPDTLFSVAEAFHTWPESAIVHGDIRRWNEDGPIDVVTPPSNRGYRGRVLMPVHHPACFARRELFSRFGAFDTTFRVFADFDWITRVIKGGAVLRYCPRVLTNFRVGGVSTMRFAVRERYRVFRANGVGRIPAAAAVGYSCGAVLRNRRQSVRARAR